MAEMLEKIPKELLEPAPMNHGESEVIAKPQLSFAKDAWLRVRKNKGAIISLVLLVLIILMAIIGPHLSPFNPNAQDLSRANLPPRIPVLENMGIFDGSQKIWWR